MDELSLSYLCQNISTRIYAIKLQGFPLLVCSRRDTRIQFPTTQTQLFVHRIRKTREDALALPHLIRGVASNDNTLLRPETEEALKTRFESLGVFLPKNVQKMSDRIASMQNPPMFDLGAITGIKETRVASPDEDSLHLAVQAAQDCLKRSSYKASDLEVVISCSISRYVDGPANNNMFEPPLSLFIKNEIGANQAMHFDVSNACAGMFTGVLLLDRMIKAGQVKCGLVVSGEHITHISRTAVKEIKSATDPQFGSMTVGDSGAAVVMDAAQDENDYIDYLELMTCSEYSRLCIGMPSTESAGPALYTINAEMHKKDRVQLWPNYQMDYYKNKNSEIAAEKFDYIVHHQVGLKAVSNFNRYGSEYFQFQLPEPLNILEETGNTSTTSHFLVLHKALKEGTLKRGMKVLLVPAASGVVTGFLSLKISNLGV